MKTMTKEQFEEKCYQAYILDWMISHGRSFGEALHIIGDSLAGNDDDDDIREKFSQAEEHFIYEEGFGGSLWVCKDEFLGAEFKDAEYMEHLTSLMQPEMKEFWRENYRNPFPCVYSKETSAGKLLAYESELDGRPGIDILLKPNGTDEAIDIASVTVCENEDMRFFRDEEFGCVTVTTFGDVYTEDCTHHETIRKEDIEEAFK